jgi:hypothetical protein
MSRTRQPNLFILLGGLASSIFALGVVALVNLLGFNIMGLNVLFIIPAGAIGVGLVSGVGYALCSKLFNVKIRNDFLVIILLLAVVTYCLSHYFTYLILLRREGLGSLDVSFLEYFRQMSESSTLTSSRSGSNSEGVRLGVWGYLFLLLELIGFSIGTLIPTMMLGSSPYCDRCQLYMDKVETTYHSSGLVKKNLKQTKGKEQKQELLIGAIQDVMVQFAGWWEQIYGLNWDDVDAHLDQQKTTPPRDTLAHIQAAFYVCPTCSHWHVLANLHNATLNGQPISKPILDSRTLLPPPPPEFRSPPPPPPPPGGESDDRVTR